MTKINDHFWSWDKNQLKTTKINDQIWSQDIQTKNDQITIGHLFGHLQFVTPAIKKVLYCFSLSNQLFVFPSQINCFTHFWTWEANEQRHIRRSQIQREEQKMKEDILKSPLTLKVAGLQLLAIACFYLGKHWASDYDQVQIIIGSISSSVQSRLQPMTSLP